MICEQTIYTSPKTIALASLLILAIFPIGWVAMWCARNAPMEYVSTEFEQGKTSRRFGHLDGGDHREMRGKVVAMGKCVLCARSGHLESYDSISGEKLNSLVIPGSASAFPFIRMNDVLTSFRDAGHPLGGVDHGSVEKGDQEGVSLETADGSWTILFNRQGSPGGTISVRKGNTPALTAPMANEMKPNVMPAGLAISSK